MRTALLWLALLLAPLQAAQAGRYSLSFDGTAFGFAPLGEVTINLDVDESRYEAEARLRSGGILSLFERTRLVARASGRVEANGVVFERYELDHHYSGKHRAISMQREGANLHAAITPNFRNWGEPPATEAQRLASRDPLSSIVAMAVDVGRTHRCANDYPTFDGRFHYRLELRDGRIARVNARGFRGPALRCTLRYAPVAGFDANDNGSRLRTARGEIWFALLEGQRVSPPVHISAPLPVGSAQIRLSRMQRPSVDIGEGAPT